MTATLSALLLVVAIFMTPFKEDKFGNRGNILAGFGLAFLPALAGICLVTPGSVGHLHLAMSILFVVSAVVLAAQGGGRLRSLSLPGALIAYAVAASIAILGPFPIVVPTHDVAQWSFNNHLLAAMLMPFFVWMARCTTLEAAGMTTMILFGLAIQFHPNGVAADFYGTGNSLSLIAVSLLVLVFSCGLIRATEIISGRRFNC